MEHCQYDLQPYIQSHLSLTTFATLAKTPLLVWHYITSVLNNNLSAIEMNTTFFNINLNIGIFIPTDLFKLVTKASVTLSFS
jgi:hypothetical protein